MLDSARKIVKYTESLDYLAFKENDLVIDAVARYFEIIDKAANRIDSLYKQEKPQIEWLRITGFRNRIIHEYFGIDIEIMWSIISENIPLLTEKLKIFI